MNKKLLLGGILGLFLATFVACGNKEERKGETEMSANCFLLQTNPYAYTAAYGQCNFNYGVHPGFSNVRNHSAGVGLGSELFIPICSSGKLVYSPSKGLGCVSNNQVYLGLSGQPVYYMYNPSSNTFVPSSVQGLYPPNTGASVPPVLRVCDDSEPCPDGQSCRSPFGPYVSSAIGICYF